jgi:hypothetical protein
MTQKNQLLSPENMSCANCALRKKAEANPGKFLSRLWRWHTKWCPGWKAYQKALSETQH